jgi:hypothetical protein
MSMEKFEDHEVDAHAGVRDERGIVEVMYVYDRVLKANFVRVRFKSKARHLNHIISSGDVPADLPTRQLELNIARMGGALCERHCERYKEVIDPDQAAAAAVEGFRRLKEMVNSGQFRITAH